MLNKQQVRRLEPAHKFCDFRYGKLNQAWLACWHEAVSEELSRLGIVRRDARFDCNRFVEAYPSLTEVALPPNVPFFSLIACTGNGPYRYLTGAGTAHAVFQALTVR